MKKNMTPDQALQELVDGNRIYMNTVRNPADISRIQRIKTAQRGQSPYAVILTCSDSRVPPEHIFTAGIGDIFVVRTAGNVVGDFEIGSIEYAVQYLYVPLIVVMGHTRCGAVEAALEGYAEGYIETVIDEIQLGLNGAEKESDAIFNNILHSGQRILQSEIVSHLIQTGKLMMIGAEYDIKDGSVRFYSNKRLWPKENSDWDRDS